MKTKKWKRLLSPTILFFSFLLLCWYLSVYGDKFKVLRSLEPHHIVIFLILVLTCQLVLSIQIKIFMGRFKFVIPYVDSFFLYSIASYWNYLPARMGSIFRAVYLNSHFKVPFYLYAVYAGFMPLISFIFASGLGLAICFILWLSGMTVPEKVVIFFFASLALCFFVIRVDPKRVISRLPNIESLRKGVASWGQARGDVVLILRVLAVQLFLVVVSTLRWCFLFSVLYGEPKLFYSVFFTIFSTSAVLISITPGSLGIHEGFIVISSILLGFPPEDAILIALVDRAGEMIVTFIAGPISQYRLERMKTKKKRAR